MPNRVRIGVDVGGTFTDLVLADEDEGLVFTDKLLTTPDDPGRAIVEGLKRLLSQSGRAPDIVHSVVHGTTLVTNTIIEQTGATVGLITTRGFRDALEMGREIRYDLYDLFLEATPTLVPRHRRLGVPGRFAPDGEELEPFDADRFRAAVSELLESGIDALAVSFVHSYRHHAHEQRAGDILREEFPELPFTLSHRVAPEIREFERTSTACANAYVQPMMRGYLGRFEQSLSEIGFRARLYVMLSGGGIATLEQAVIEPIQLIESGPAAGAMAASHYGRLLGKTDLISFDMGGTTAKMCLIEGGRAARTREFEAGRVRRFAKGSGLPLKVSVVDMIEIGAGGGSIASIDSMGLLKVGPRSAGSVPGPVAYGRGGQEPTVTDADLMLGYLNPAYFLGGEMALGPRAVQAALSERLATPLALPLMEVALGIHRVVNENMAAATRRYLAEKGKDVRDYAMVAFGGAGPVHAYALAKLLKISQVVVPFAAGVTSALGFLVAPPATDDVRSYVTRLDALDWGSVKALYDDMEAIARNRLTEAGADPDQVVFNRHADMRYVGQGFEIEVPVAPEAIAEESIESLRESFYATYHRLFERSVRDVAIETLSWRLSAHAPPSSVPLSFPRAQTEDAGTRGARELTFPAFGAVRAAVWDRYTLQTGERIVGPAVIEERESTTVMGPDATAVVDEHLNLIIAIDQ